MMKREVSTASSNTSVDTLVSFLRRITGRVDEAEAIQFEQYLQVRNCIHTPIPLPVSPQSRTTSVTFEALKENDTTMHVLFTCSV